jgi:hypothetical protein
MASADAIPVKYVALLVIPDDFCDDMSCFVETFIVNSRVKSIQTSAQKWCFEIKGRRCHRPEELRGHVSEGGDHRHPSFVSFIKSHNAHQQRRVRSLTRGHLSDSPLAYGIFRGKVGFAEIALWAGMEPGV